MRYMRCKCGKCECWTSMGHASCDGCDECNSTLAEGPDGHRDIAPHDFREEWEIDPKTGVRWRVQKCLRCYHEEKVEGSDEERD
jgi:hypothetical protein